MSIAEATEKSMGICRRASRGRRGEYDRSGRGESSRASSVKKAYQFPMRTMIAQNQMSWEVNSDPNNVWFSAHGFFQV